MMLTTQVPSPYVLVLHPNIVENGSKGPTENLRLSYSYKVLKLGVGNSRNKVFKSETDHYDPIETDFLIRYNRLFDRNRLTSYFLFSDTTGSSGSRVRAHP